MSGFTPLGQYGADSSDDSSFWPSFTDIMMVVVLIFLMATSLLIVRNWNLVAELQSSIEAEKQAEMIIETTSLENATLEERLANAEHLNSILRLRLLDKEEQLKKATLLDTDRIKSIQKLELSKIQLMQQIQEKISELQQASQQIESLTVESQELGNQIAELKSELQKQIELTQVAQQELELASAEISILSATQADQQESIKMLEREKIDYNRQILTLKGDYEVVKSKYEQLIKPARSAKGKYIAEVYYVKKNGKEVIRFKLPGDTAFKDITHEKVHQKLTQLKKEKGEDLYVKIIIPQKSGLTYNEAWGFMREMLDKYDYYYQRSSDKEEKSE